MNTYPTLIDGQWRNNGETLLRPRNPATGETLESAFPVSSAADLGAMLDAGVRAAQVMAKLPASALADFLDDYARRIEASIDMLAPLANLETGLPGEPRLRNVELPRTINQLRQAAAAARSGEWALATIDSKTNIRSCLAPLGGPVLVLGPNNFPFAYNGIAGGDFASAIAAGNPVIAKAHPCHPGTTHALAKLAFEALSAAGLPRALVQMFYHCSEADGLALMGDRRLGAIGFTGSRKAGMRIKQAADAAGIPSYLEMSSVNPVFVLPGALQQRGEAIATDFTGSALLGCGQFCTNPGIILLPKGAGADAFVAKVSAAFQSATPGVLLAESLVDGLASGVAVLTSAGARLICGGARVNTPGFRFANTLLTVDGATFLANASALQTEVFGPCSLAVIYDDVAQLARIASVLEGGLTASVYSATDGVDDAAHDQLVIIVRPKTGRLLNDKMPTGVAVVASMVHGGPFPATGHPGFTAVGFPASVRRFAALHCYDNVRAARLPAILQNTNPAPKSFRLVDGVLTQGDVPSA